MTTTPARPDHAPLDQADFDALASVPHVLPLGIDATGAAVAIDTVVSPHLMITGPTASGKTVATSVLVAGMLAAGWEVHVITGPKATDYLWARSWLASLITTESRAREVLSAVVLQVRQRAELLHYYGAGSVHDLPERDRPTPIAVVLDDVDLLAGDGATAKEIHRLVAVLTRGSRSVDVHVVVSAQRVTPAGIASTSIRDVASVIIMGKVSQHDRQVALRDPSRAPDHDGDVPRGRGIFEHMHASPILFQGFFDHPLQDRLQGVVTRVRRPRA